MDNFSFIVSKILIINEIFYEKKKKRNSKEENLDLAN